jgi:hypothetical protein
MTGKRPPLSDDTWQKFCELPTIKGRVDDPRLRRHVEQIIAESWFLHTMTKKVPWKKLLACFAKAEASKEFAQVAQAVLDFLERIPLMFEHSRHGAGNSCILWD